MADLGSLLGAAGIGGMIGKAVVQLELDTGKYATELNAAEAQTKASTTTMGSSTSRFSGLAQTAFLAAGAAAVAGLGMSVKAALEAQEAQAALHNTIANAPQLAASSEQAFLNLAESIRSTTGADDEAILGGIALQGQMGLEQDAIEKLTPLVVDLATKHDIDLQSAFKAVGKAATGSTGALSRYVGAIEAGATPAETLQNVLTKLGGAAGFAADKAKREPWLLFKSNMEEISEDIGTALLPAIASLADALNALMPVIEGVAKAVRYLPLFQMAADIGTTQNAVEKLTNAMIDSIPVLGSYVDLTIGLGHSFPELSKAVEDVTEKLPGFADGLDQTAKAGKGAADAADEARRSTVKFAHMTDDELEKWKDSTIQSFDTYTMHLEDLTSDTDITRRDLNRAFKDMEERAEDLNQAMKRISREKWLNEDFIKFLSEQGPEWLIAFSGANEREQRKWQEEWKNSQDDAKGYETRLDKITGALNGIDTSNTRHTIEIHYKYVDFDPSKPGMSPQQR